MLDRLGWLLRQAARRARLLDPTLALVVAGVSWAALWNCRSFFIDYPRTAPPNLWTEAGPLARAAGPTSKTYMVSPMHIYFYSPEMRFLARGLVGADVPIGGIPVHERGYRDGLFLVSPALPDAVERLRTSYPHGQLAEHRDRHDRLLFTAYRVDVAEMNAAAPTGAPWQQYDLRFGMGGKAFGEFENPSGLAVGREGLIYVADTGNGRIDVFDRDGKPVAALGQRGDGEGEFRNLCAVAEVPDGSILGLDCETHWIKRFGRSGRWLGNFGGPEHLTTPSGLAVAPDGSVVVTDAGQQAILRFDPCGALVSRAGASGDGPGQFVKPEAIAVSGDGSVYVVDGASARVQRFSAQLEYQLQWSLPRAQAGMAIAVANARGGAVYVTDPAHGHVQRYTPDGDAEWTVGAQGNDPAKLTRPAAVATDGAGSVYVLDGGRNQVFRYDVTRQPP
jgi:DNA-binding beta-propeller fold protein YncE